MSESEGAKVIPIRTMRDALSYGDGWQAQYRRLEAAYMLATAQRDASDLLLRLAEEERDRMKALFK